MQVGAKIFIFKENTTEPEGKLTGIKCVEP